MSWIQTYTGKRFYPLAPNPEDICLDDIMHALRLQCRFAGHCKRHYSVLEHSVRVARLLPQEFRGWALLHDASEAYISDLARPLKYLPEFAGYRQIEANLMAAICQHFGLPIEQPEIVDRADKAMLWWEYKALFQQHLPEWEQWRVYGEEFPRGQIGFFSSYGVQDFEREFVALAEEAGLR